MTREAVELKWGHLERLTGPLGIFEHAVYSTPRFTHGYTVDDNARVLVLAARYRPDLARGPYLEMVLGGWVPQGWRNRLSVNGLWTERVGSHDAAGRAVWGLGELIAAGESGNTTIQTMARGMEFRSQHPRATAYLVLGAAAAASVALPGAIDCVRENLKRLPRLRAGDWPWPAPRLTYANARIPEALIRGGLAVSNERAVQDGLVMLDWLANLEFGSNGFSFTSVDGRGAGERGPAFDQQPIEAWAMADACQAASQIDGSERWRDRVVDAALWFLGRNDTGVSLYERVTGAGYDGLTCTGRNLNQGAESTLAALGALSHLPTFDRVAPS